MDTLIKAELFKNIDSFINEISLTMDYISPELIREIEEYTSKIKADDELLNKFVIDTNSHLSNFEVKFSGALFSNKKVKSSYFDFLSDIILFSETSPLNFKLFKNESKATKKAFISYLYNIYVSCLFLVKFKDCKNLDFSKESNFLQDFIDKIKSEADTAIESSHEKAPTKRKNVTPRSTSTLEPQLPDLASIMSGMGGMGDIMSSILGNQEILNIASDISSQMQNQQLDPMSMLSSLMSGNMVNSPLNGLITQIQQKVETKISSGEIDKNVLESQAQSIMSNINPEQMTSLPGMAEMIKNMAEAQANNK